MAILFKMLQKSWGVFIFIFHCRTLEISIWRFSNWIIHSWGFLVWPLHKGMEGFPSPFGSLKAILWDWSYFSVGLISLYAIPKNCAVIHFFGIAWSDFQSSRFVTWPICYSLLIKKKFLRGESNPSPLDKTCMLYQLSYWGMVEMSALKLIYKTKQIFF